MITLVRFSILDIRKLLMYHFHYNHIKAKYDCDTKLLFTDSLIYEIERNNLYEGFYRDKKIFNFSDYPIYLQFYDPINKKVIGNW